MALWRVSLVAALVAVVFGSQGAMAAGNEEIARAQALMKSGKPGEAYVILERFEFEKAGDTNFDYLLGIAALDSGKPDKATLAFERVLALTPNSAGVRLDMARAYFALGDYPRAKRELIMVGELNPPPAAKAVIEKYQSLIEEQERARQTTISGYLEGFAGRDDNITSVVGNFTGAVQSTYGLPGFQPTGNSVLRASDVSGVAGGVELSHKIDENLGFHAGADQRYRMVTTASNYDSEQLDARLGLNYTQDANTWRGGLSYQNFRQKTDTVGVTANRTANGVNLEWRRALGANDQLGLLGLYTQQRFQDVPTNDIDTQMLGINWLHIFTHDFKPLLYSSLIVGQDEAKNKLGNGSNVGKDSMGLRFYGQLSTHETLDVFASLGYLERTDRAAYARSTLTAFGKDQITDYTVGLNWRPAKNWLVRPQISYSENSSNVAISEYKRTEVTFTVRHDFR